MVQLVRAPDGSFVQFPDGTDDATIDGVMRQHFGQPDDPASPEGRAYEAKMQAELRDTQLTRDATAANAQDSGFVQGARTVLRHGLFGWGPEVEGFMQAPEGVDPQYLADVRRRQDDLNAVAHPTRNALLSVGGGVAGAVAAAPVLEAAPLIGPALDAAGTLLGRIPYLTGTASAAL